MALQTFTRLYDNHTEAVAAVQALEAAGFGHDHVSLIGWHGDHANPLGTAADPDVNETSEPVDEEAGHSAVVGAGAGASLGTVVGGGLGLLAGIGLLIIPGIGPVVAAGWLVSTLTGAGIGAAIGGAGGGLVGTLTHAGVSEEDAHVFAEGVRRGGSLVTARVETDRAAEAERILDHTGPVDPAVRRGIYQEGGWTRFEEGAGSA